MTIVTVRDRESSTRGTNGQTQTRGIRAANYFTLPFDDDNMREKYFCRPPALSELASFFISRLVIKVL